MKKRPHFPQLLADDGGLICLKTGLLHVGIGVCIDIVRALFHRSWSWDYTLVGLFLCGVFIVLAVLLWLMELVDTGGGKHPPSDRPHDLSDYDGFMHY
ncbi:MAG: hypothetical protein SPL12_05120 [Bacteroidales bacterium]|nr:hypothetical protein [Bacteroidales bacterium]